jgi:hypothetical protein
VSKRRASGASRQPREVRAAGAAARSQRRKPPRLRATSSLVLLGSAAVFTVYAVGYAGTQPSYDRLQEQIALLDATSTPLTLAAARAINTPTPG